MQNKPRLIFLLNSAQRHLQQWMAQQTEAASRQGQQAPTPAQSGVIFALDKADGATMGELAQTLDLAPSAVSGLIQRMEALDWVTRHPCPQDGRTQRVWLRPSGQKLMPVLRQATTRINARLTEGFTEAELQTIARWLTHVQRLDQVDQPET
ncbi:MarR family winged helix-turn-helix transcriptional regulator [Aquabacterium sp. UBA2148]|uniref:MarR family winged helix-turn-helix transcriptional regulator n=1 Tax=Aquabacterium sp. UBA2148 TaxID=1946042 RepID=UPI00257F03C9|nr:MarR family winged helix-turn-helix transcriptional regulator [Aquabacterium sp. UBA2148]